MDRRKFLKLFGIGIATTQVGSCGVEITRPLTPVTVPETTVTPVQDVVTTPAHCFISDTNTGLFFSSSDTISVAIGGNEIRF